MDDKETGRLEAFSDGVFSIAITLLVLELKVPHLGDYANDGDLLMALLQQWPSYIAYLVSFATILIIWVNHHRLFNLIHKVDGRLMFLNGLLLLTVSTIPFPTALLAEHFRRPGATTAAAAYSGTYVLMAIAFNAIWHYASHGHRLLKSSVTREHVRRVTGSYWLGPTLYGAAFVAAFFHVYLSVGLCAALAVFYAIFGY